MRSGLIAAVVGVCAALSPIAAHAASIHPSDECTTVSSSACESSTIYDAGDPTIVRAADANGGQGLLTAWLGGGALMLTAGAITMATSIRRTRKAAGTAETEAVIAS